MAESKFAAVNNSSIQEMRRYETCVVLPSVFWFYSRIVNIPDLESDECVLSAFVVTACLVVGCNCASLLRIID
jgi:hypothetical protein